MGKPWYPLLVSFLAFADAFVLTLPTDGFLVAAVMANKKRWCTIALVVSLGSTLGAWLLALLFLWQRPWLEAHLPVLSSLGLDSTSFPRAYGDLALFFGAVGPIPMHPFVLLAALSGFSLARIAFWVFVGRLVKYLFLAWVARGLPGFFARILRPALIRFRG